MLVDRRTFLAGTTASAFAASTPAVSASDLSGDVQIVQEVLTKMHPGLLRYNTQRQIDAAIEQFRKIFVSADSLPARFLALSRLTATLRCGHSYANFFNQERSVSEQLFAGRTRLPLSFLWVSGRMVVLQDQSGTDQLSRGMIVARINGVRPSEMLERMLPLTRADGSNDDKRRALLSVMGTQRIETFDVFRDLLYGEPEGGTFRIEGVDARGRRIQAVLPPINLERRQAFIRALDANRGDKPIWDWAERPDGIVVLTMNDWALYNSKWAWKEWLNERLDSLRGAKGLIIDIRANEGGNDCGDVILSRLARQDIPRPKIKRLVRYRRAPEMLHPYLDTWDKSFLDWGEEAMLYDERFFELKGEAGADVLPAKGPTLNVPLVVLTSAENSSATFQFAQLVRQTGLGTLVGETTGGNQRGINGGAYFFVRLPASGLEFDLPLIGYFPEVRRPDAGIAPDVPVVMAASDIASGVDRQMEAAIRRLI